MAPESFSARPGRAFPLGAFPGPDGTNFAIASEIADTMDLCLFDPDGAEHRIPMVDHDAGVFHALVPGVGPGQAYGFRAGGPWDPARGLRCNPNKLLLDPYARATTGEVSFGPAVLGQDVDAPLAPSSIDSAGSVPLSLVVDPAHDWADDVRPHHRYADTVFYELHPRGFTMRHPEVPEELRGTYAGLAHDAVLEHLSALGVTAVELLPVHQSVPESFLVERGLTNYWGYNTIGYFAPHDGYSAAVRAGRPGGQVEEFKAMVARFHAAGLEVVLDVVFNHTAEAGPNDATLCFRGIDNPGYYRLQPEDPSRYVDTTGCGNSLDSGSPLVLKLILDSLRYWVEEMHVDGFRFDLASTLARQHGSFERTSAFFDLIAQDPVIGTVKLIAEPWDVGQADSYDLGRFPSLWTEWNGRYRDTVRDFWRGAEGLLPDLATRLTGSADLFGGSRRRPTASVNIITVHDGFTLRDLVSYDEKHNDANGEGNRDGSNDNRSWNGGVEGPTQDPAVLENRDRRSRAMLTTLFTSFGVPLLVGGDEFGRTQQGSNNPYCQDNEISWVDWSGIDTSLLEFTRRAIALRRAHPVLRRRRFLTGAEAHEVQWFTPSGDAMTDENWADPGARCVTVYLDGTDAPDRDENGNDMVDDDLLVVINGWWEPLDVTIPTTSPDARWTVALDSARDELVGERLEPGRPLTVAGRSVVVLTGAAAA